MTSTKNKEGEKQGSQNFGQFCEWLYMVFGEGVFLSVICKDFLGLRDCSELHCFLEAS